MEQFFFIFTEMERHAFLNTPTSYLLLPTKKAPTEKTIPAGANYKLQTSYGFIRTKELIFLCVQWHRVNLLLKLRWAEQNE